MDDLQIWDEYTRHQSLATVVLIDPEGYIIASFSGGRRRNYGCIHISAALKFIAGQLVLNYVPVCPISNPTISIFANAATDWRIGDVKLDAGCRCRCNITGCWFNLRNDIKPLSVTAGRFRNGDFSTTSSANLAEWRWLTTFLLWMPETTRFERSLRSTGENGCWKR